MSNTEVANPISEAANARLDDESGRLRSEIVDGLVTLYEGKTWLVERELQQLKVEAENDPNPSTTYDVLLFRKYAETIIRKKEESRKSVIPVLLPESGDDERLLNGYDAVKSNLFWLRAFAAVFALISCVVMATVHGVSELHYHTERETDVVCP